MRAWIQSSLFGVPLPERILPSVSRTSSVLALARPGLRRVGMKKVSVPGIRALACPNALERPKRSTMRLARTTLRLSVGPAPRRLFALLMLHFVPQGEQGFGDERRALFASGEPVDRSSGGEGALEPLHRADFPENPGAAVDLLRRENRPGEFVVARLVGEGPVPTCTAFAEASPRSAAGACAGSSRSQSRSSEPSHQAPTRCSAKSAKPETPRKSSWASGHAG